MRVPPSDSEFADVERLIGNKLPACLKEQFTSGAIQEAYYDFIEEDDDTGFVHKLRFVGVTQSNLHVLRARYQSQISEFDGAVLIAEDDFLNPIIAAQKDCIWAVYRIDLEIDGMVFQLASEIADFLTRLRESKA